MHILLKDTRDPRYIRLGIQTNPGCEFMKALWLADQWAPSRAKSFRIVNYYETTYSGLPVEIHEGPTGYASVWVTYFTTIKEGHFRVGDYKNYLWSQYNSKADRINNK